MPDTLALVGEAIAAALAAPRAGAQPLVVGLCGAQGSGKSTLAAGLVDRLAADGRSAAVLSIDDLYLTRAERERLGATIHPLLRTRGVPGTHDVALGIAIFAALDAGGPALLPRFDKARDDRMPADRWAAVPAAPDVLLFEGWCVGARPQPEAALAAPINPLEEDEDRDGRWRRYVNAALAGDYQRLFARIDLLILLAAPGFAIVRDWRIEQEHRLRDQMRARSGADAPGVMSDAEVERFIRHYERLTRSILAEMPGRADLVVALDAARAGHRAGHLTGHVEGGLR